VDEGPGRRGLRECRVFFIFPALAEVCLPVCGSSSVGRASAFQAECRRFEPGLPLSYVEAPAPLRCRGFVRQGEELSDHVESVACRGSDGRSNRQVDPGLVRRGAAQCDGAMIFRNRAREKAHPRPLRPSQGGRHPPDGGVSVDGARRAARGSRRGAVHVNGRLTRRSRAQPRDRAGRVLPVYHGRGGSLLQSMSPRRWTWFRSAARYARRVLRRHGVLEATCPPRHDHSGPDVLMEPQRVPFLDRAAGTRLERRCAPCPAHPGTPSTRW
jgi:hypothetical protein